jgi:hypothetical protein
MMRTPGKMQLITLFLILLAGAFGQTAPVPYAQNSGPTFTNDQASHPYPGSYPSIRKVDFRNLRFLTFDKDGKQSGDFTLRNGSYRHDEPQDYQSIDLNAVHYLGRSSSDDGASALVLLSYLASAGSSGASKGGMAKVFTVENGHLRVVQEIDWDSHFEAGQPTESFDPSKKGTLVIRSAHYLPGDAPCCVSAMEVLMFRWDGTHFVQTGTRTELSEYGKKEGKTIPR